MAVRLPDAWAEWARSSGQCLPQAVQRKMEGIFGVSFSQVRISVVPQAQHLGAVAFTQGSNIYFAPGRYNPHTMDGQRVLAHELAHVVQQMSGRVKSPFKNGVALVRDARLDAEASRMAARATATTPPVQPKPQSTLRAVVLTPKKVPSNPPAVQRMQPKSAAVHGKNQAPSPARKPVYPSVPAHLRSLPIQTKLTTRPEDYGIPKGVQNDDADQREFRNYWLRAYVADEEVSTTHGDAKKSLAQRVDYCSGAKVSEAARTGIPFRATWKEIDDQIKSGSAVTSKWSQLPNLLRKLDKELELVEKRHADGVADDAVDLNEEFGGRAYDTKRAEVARVMGIEDKHHAAHGANFNGAQSLRQIINDLWRPVSPAQRPAVGARLTTQYGYSPG